MSSQFLEKKPAHKSRTIQAGAAEIANGALGLLAIAKIIPFTVVMPVISIVAGLVTIWGRKRAKTKIK